MENPNPDSCIQKRILRDKTFDREKENLGDYSVPYI